MSLTKPTLYWSLGALQSGLPALTGPGNMLRAVFQKVCNSPLQVAWPWSRTPRAFSVILSLGLTTLPLCPSRTSAELLVLQPRFATELVPALGTTHSCQPSLSLGSWAREVFVDVQCVAIRIQNGSPRVMFPSLK